MRGESPKGESMTDDANARKERAIKEAAKELPQTVKFLRRRYPEWLSTSDIATALHLGKGAVLDELNGSRRRVNRNAGTQHGTNNTALWQYKPTAAETPWSLNYVN
jgi:hypothetical protein